MKNANCGLRDEEKLLEMHGEIMSKNYVFIEDSNGFNKYIYI